MRRKAPKKEKKDNHVNFRLDDDLAYDRLLTLARQFDLSHNLYARECLINLLNEPLERAELTRRVAAQEAAVNELRSDLALSVQALLIASGNYTEQEAHSWVQEQFNVP